MLPQGRFAPTRSHQVKSKGKPLCFGIVFLWGKWNLSLWYGGKNGSGKRSMVDGVRRLWDDARRGGDGVVVALHESSDEVTLSHDTSKSIQQHNIWLTIGRRGIVGGASKIALRDCPYHPS